jgi:hypothetical protein
VSPTLLLRLLVVAYCAEAGVWRQVPPRSKARWPLAAADAGLVSTRYAVTRKAYFAQSARFYAKRILCTERGVDSKNLLKAHIASLAQKTHQGIS